MSRMTWDDLVMTSVVGTRARALPDGALPEPTTTAGEQVDRADPATALLDLAALLAVARDAGVRARRDATAVAPPAGGQQVPSSTSGRISRVLSSVLTNPYGVELLADLARSGVQAPADSVVALLEVGRTHPHARDVVRALVGELGVWLAQQRPAWEWADDSATPHPATDPFDDTEVWRSGPRRQRLAWLQEAVRADPQRAVEAVEEVWPQERAEIRAAFLDAMGPPTTSRHEELLTECLRDRAGSVRDVALALLRDTPDTAYRTRMAQHLSSLITATEVDGVRSLVVETPQLSAELEADGICERHPKGSAVMGPSWWLAQLVRAAPLTAWTEATGWSPGDVLAARVTAPTPPQLGAWLEAAVGEQRDAAWGRAAYRWTSHPDRFLRFLPPDELAEELPRAMSSTWAWDNVLPAVRGAGSPWPTELTRAVLALATTRQRPVSAAVTTELLSLAAARAAVGDLPRLTDALMGMSRSHTTLHPDAADQAHALAVLRDRILQEIR